MQVLENRWQWSQRASFVNRITNQPETWLVCIAGFAACKVCRSYTGHIRKGDSFAQGTGSFLKFQKHFAAWQFDPGSAASAFQELWPTARHQLGT